MLKNISSQQLSRQQQNVTKFSMSTLDFFMIRWSTSMIICALFYVVCNIFIFSYNKGTILKKSFTSNEIYISIC